MIVQVAEKAERRPLKDPAEAPGLFSRTYNLKVGSGNPALSFLWNMFTGVRLEISVFNRKR